MLVCQYAQEKLARLSSDGNQLEEHLYYLYLSYLSSSLPLNKNSLKKDTKSFFLSFSPSIEKSR
jgi:hypothetical protein